jgi:hypothetical protein
MKKRLSIMVVFAVLTLNNSYAQDLLTLKTENPKVESKNPEKINPVFEFKAYLMDFELDGISEEMAGPHPFGEMIAKKLYLLDEKYSSQVAIRPGDPAMKTVIKKPVIYESVKRIERDLKRSVKKQEIHLIVATNEFSKVLDVALNIDMSDTKDFENAIESAGSTNSKIELFTKRVILNY